MTSVGLHIYKCVCVGDSGLTCSPVLHHHYCTEKHENFQFSLQNKTKNKATLRYVTSNHLIYPNTAPPYIALGNTMLHACPVKVTGVAVLTIARQVLA